MIADLTILALLIALAGYCNGYMDYIKVNELDKDSWKNKWKWFPVFKNGDDWTKDRDPYKTKWYYFGLYKPQFVEKFPYSSTILVALTDDWHAFKWLMFVCYESFISAMFCKGYQLEWYCVPVGILILKTIRGIFFSLKYDHK